MRYMMFIKHPNDYADTEAPASLQEAMGTFVEEQTNKGVFVDGAGLEPLTMATRVSLSKGEISVTDGPFAETTEVVGGYALIEVDTHAEALELAKTFMELHRIHWPGFEGQSELRPLEGAA